jgi:hypothetical protein
MSDITKEQIQKLEKIGLTIIDNISDEFDALKEKSDRNTKTINTLYTEFEKIFDKADKEEYRNGN